MVGPDAIGGAEQIFTQIDEVLVARGHRLIVVAPWGSRIKGELMPVPLIRGPLDTTAHAAAIAATRSAINAAVAEHSIDVVHIHALRFEAYLPPPGPPVLAILHVPPALYSSMAFHIERPETFVNCVSDSQHASLPLTLMHVL